MNKNVPLYTPSVRELADKIQHIVDNYMFENRCSQADINSFFYDEKEYNQVAHVVTGRHRKDIAFLRMNNGMDSKEYLSTLTEDARYNGVQILKDVLDACMPLHQGSRIMSKVGTHVFEKGEHIRSIHKDLHGRFVVVDKGRERSLRHPFGIDYVTLRDSRNTAKPPFKIYPSKMMDVAIAVMPKGYGRPASLIGDVNAFLGKLPVKDYDIELLDPIYLTSNDYNPSIENQYSSHTIDKIGIRQGRIASFHTDANYDIECLSAGGQQRIADAVNGKRAYLLKFNRDSADKQEMQRLFEKSRALQDGIAAIGDLKPFTSVMLDRGIPLDDLPVIDSIGDMVVNQVTYLGSPNGHAIFTVNDGDRQIPFSRLTEWNQEQVADAVKEQLKYLAEISSMTQGVINAAKVNDFENRVMPIVGIKYGVQSSKSDSRSHAITAFKVVEDGQESRLLLGTYSRRSEDFDSLEPVIEPKDITKVVNTGGDDFYYVTDILNDVLDSITYHKESLEQQKKEAFKDERRRDILSLMDELKTEKIHLIRPFGVEKKDHEGIDFGEEAIAIIKHDDDVFLSDGKNELSVSCLTDWQIHELVNMVYGKPLRDLLKNGETFRFKCTVDNSMSSGYLVDDYLFDSITKYGDVLSGGGVRSILTQNNQQSSRVFTAFPVGCTYQVYKEVKAAIENKRMKEKTHDSLEYDVAESEALVIETIIKRATDSSAKAFTPDQREVVMCYLKDFETVDQKMQALSALWEAANQDERMKDTYGEWKVSVKEELNDIASGVKRGIYTKVSLLPISSEWHLAEQHNAVPDLLPTQGNNATSECKSLSFL